MLQFTSKIFTSSKNNSLEHRRDEDSPLRESDRLDLHPQARKPKHEISPELSELVLSSLSSLSEKELIDEQTRYLPMRLYVEKVADQLRLSDQAKKTLLSHQFEESFSLHRSLNYALNVSRLTEPYFRELNIVTYSIGKYLRPRIEEQFHAEDLTAIIHFKSLDRELWLQDSFENHQDELAKGIGDLNPDEALFFIEHFSRLAARPKIFGALATKTAKEILHCESLTSESPEWRAFSKLCSLTCRDWGHQEARKGSQLLSLASMVLFERINKGEMKDEEVRDWVHFAATLSNSQHSLQIEDPKIRIPTLESIATAFREAKDSSRSTDFLAIQKRFQFNRSEIDQMPYLRDDILECYHALLRERDVIYSISFGRSYRMTLSELITPEAAISFTWGEATDPFSLRPFLALIRERLEKNR